MGIDESLVQEIVRRILSVTKPDRTIIFGSAATGEMTRDSDIDILVVERDPGDWHDESVRIRHALRGLGYLFDVIVLSTEWFEESKNVIDGLQLLQEFPQRGSALMVETYPELGSAAQAA